MAKKKKKKKTAKKTVKKKVAKKKVAKKKVAKKAAVKKKPQKKKTVAKKKTAKGATAKKKAPVKAKAKPLKAKPKAKPVAKAKVKAKSPVKQKGAVQAPPEPAAPPAPLKVERRVVETAEPRPARIEFSGELYSDDDLDYFRNILTTERNKILDKARAAVQAGNIQMDSNEMYDEVDQASAMVEQNLNLRLLDRDRKLLNEIEHAIKKVETGEFGYCEGTGEPIPKRRLELRPWTRHSVKYKERLERMKKSGRGVVDEDEL